MLRMQQKVLAVKYKKYTSYDLSGIRWLSLMSIQKLTKTCLVKHTTSK